MNIGKYYEFPSGTTEVTRDQIYYGLGLVDEPKAPYGLFMVWAYSQGSSGSPAIVEVENQGGLRMTVTNPCIFPEVASTSDGVIIPVVKSADVGNPYTPYTKTMGHNDKFYVSAGATLCVYYLNLEAEVI